MIKFVAFCQLGLQVGASLLRALTCAVERLKAKLDCMSRHNATTTYFSAFCDGLLCLFLA